MLPPFIALPGIALPFSITMPRPDDRAGLDDAKEKNSPGTVGGVHNHRRQSPDALRLGMQRRQYASAIGDVKDPHSHEPRSHANISNSQFGLEVY
jgi:hypothetical protein